MSFYFAYYVILIMALLSFIKEYKDQNGEMISVGYVVSAVIMLISDYLLKINL